MTNTAALVDEIFRRCETLSPDEAFASRTLLLDVLGVTLAGTRTSEGQSVARTLQALGRRGHVRVPGIATGYDCMAAALAAGTCAYSIGLTDTHAVSITHPGPSIVAVVMAVGQEVRASGTDALRAIAAGCEAVVRIGSAVSPSHRARGFHPTATCNTFGAAVAASLLLGLDRTHMLWALGLAGSMAGGLYEFRREGAMLMALHGGLPATNGILAATLARDGFTGPTTVLEGPEGFFHAYADDVDATCLTERHPELAVQALSYRPYCACRYGHAAIDALLQLMSAHQSLNCEDIGRITVHTHKVAVEQETDPVSVIGARLSTRFNVAMAAVHGPRMSEVREVDLTDSAVIGLASRIDVVEDPGLTAMFPTIWSCRVEVSTTSGETWVRQVNSPLGEPENPMSPAQMDEKFVRLVTPLAGDSAARALLKVVRDVGTVADVADVFDAMDDIRGGDE